MKCSVISGRIGVHKNMQLSQKQTAQDVCCMNSDSRIHKYMKIARDDSTVKFGCCDSCGLPRIGKDIRSEQTFRCSLEGRPV